ncbi:TIGR00366 family protein [Robbsia sp. KACC 23696]|uniref:short-chain fatty acid transporter n=1 Tax=Robbsia sp. KACC 23696 TaxID=3149231 RepID=UPI00325BD236
MQAGRGIRALPDTRRESWLARLAMRFAAWAERWFPDAFVFVALAVVIVAAAALFNGAPVKAVAKSFGDGFWSLIAFTLQQAMIAVTGYIIARSPPAGRLITLMARIPKSGRSAVAFIALLTMCISLLNWAVSLVFSGLLAREIARRTDIRMDYRAAGAAAYLGLGCIWGLGISSAAAQLQANASSLPKSILSITGVIPFAETIFLWQSGALALVLIVLSTAIAFWSSPSEHSAVTAQDLGVDVSVAPKTLPKRTRPGEWLEYSPILTILIVALGAGWLIQEFAGKNFLLAISNLNTYNFVMLLLGLLLHWRPRSFLDAAVGAIPATSGVLIQFPFYGGIAAIMTGAIGFGGNSLATVLAHAFVSISSTHSFAAVISIYSAVLGFFIPSGGGKWLLEAPYVMQAANDLHVHLGWAVQVYNSAEALPNLLNPFWMLPLLGVLGLRAKDIVGFTALQCLVHIPVVIFLLWALGFTLQYVAPVIPH